MASVDISALDDVRALLKLLPKGDQAARDAALEREPQLTKPAGSLGDLESLSAWLAEWQGAHPPRAEKIQVLVFAGNHGVTKQGVSAFPAEVTHQMVANFEAGGAAINQLVRQQGADLMVHSLDLDRPTEDFTVTPAMTDADCAAAMKAGALAVGGKYDVLCLGEMGIGNTTSAAAICHAIYGGSPADWVGPGTGVEGRALDTKQKVVGDGVLKHKALLADGLEILRCVGGRELAAIAGAILRAREIKLPVILDGYVATAAAACLHVTEPLALDHCVIGHVSAEPAHAKLVDALSKRPLLNLGMRLGEASGAAVAINILKCAVACHTGMATFAEAGVSDKDD